MLASPLCALPIRPILTFPRFIPSLLVLQNYPAAYAGHDYDTLLQHPAVAQAAADHMAANASRAASRAATPTAAEAEQATQAAAAAASVDLGSHEAQAAVVPEAADEVLPAAASPMEVAAVAEEVAVPAPAADVSTCQAPLAAASPPAAASPHPMSPIHSRAPSAGSLPPSPKERPLSAAAADVAAAAEADGAVLPSDPADPTLGQVFASYLRPQFQQVTQHIKAAAATAAAAAQHQLNAAQQQLLQHSAGGISGAAGVHEAAGEAVAAVAGGLLEAVAGEAVGMGKQSRPAGWLCAAQTCFPIVLLADSMRVTISVRALHTQFSALTCLLSPSVRPPLQAAASARQASFRSSSLGSSLQLGPIRKRRTSTLPPPSLGQVEPQLL